MTESKCEAPAIAGISGFRENWAVVGQFRFCGLRRSVVVNGIRRDLVGEHF